MKDLDFQHAFTERTPRIIAARKLHRSAGRRKARAFLVEGENCVDAAIATGAARDVYVTESAVARSEELIHAAGLMSIPVHPVTDKAAKTLADTVHSPGIFAVCEPVLWTLGSCLRGRPQLLSVPVETNEPGNAGTMIRVADAMGADAVLFAGDTCDPLSAKAARASAGSLFHVPVVRNRDCESVLNRLQETGIQILATAADGEVSLDEADDLLEKPTAWLFGNEAHGLSADVQERADYRVRIPITGRAESLNLATASAICLYESAKAQRRAREE